MRGQGACGLCVFQERPEQMDEEQLEKHAVPRLARISPLICALTEVLVQQAAALLWVPFLLVNSCAMLLAAYVVHSAFSALLVYPGVCQDVSGGKSTKVGRC